MTSNRSLVEDYKERERLTSLWGKDKEYQQWRQTQYENKRTERIKEKLPGLLNGNTMVWCRNGSIVSVATPCDTLVCEYKNDKSDVVDGVSKCHQFQVTLKSDTWDKASHLCDPCDVTLWVR
jgi:hypothetical protein